MVSVVSCPWSVVDFVRAISFRVPRCSATAAFSYPPAVVILRLIGHSPAPTQHTINGKPIPSVTARRLSVITLKSTRHQARLGQFDFKAVAVVLSCSFFKACCLGFPRALP
jgi:hypothetical protein